MPSYSRSVKIPGKSADELYTVIAGDIHHFLSKAAALGKYEVEPDPTKKTLNIKGSMFSAVLTCRDGEMAADVKLSLLAAPFRSKLDEGITKWLAKKFDLKNLA